MGCERWRGRHPEIDCSGPHGTRAGGVLGKPRVTLLVGTPVREAMAVSSGVSGARSLRTDFPVEHTVPLVAVLRSGKAESVHAGAVVAMEGNGELVAAAGGPELPVFWGAAATLHQTLALVLAGGVKRWELSDAQLAIMCSSHNGEPAQVRCVASILERIGLEPDALHCGAQPPHSEWAAADLLRRNEKPSPLHHRCSGNHAGLLALSRLLGGDLASYEDANAPAEQNALEVAARFSGLEVREIALGVDECGVPAYRTPLRALALAFARLMTVPREWETRIHAAATTVVNAVVRHPETIAGAGEIDMECLKAFGGAAICKLGGEGVCAAAFAPTERYPRGLGLAMKIADGTGARAIPIVLMACLEQLELGTEQQRAALEAHARRGETTLRGEVVSELAPAFELTIEGPSAA